MHAVAPRRGLILPSRFERLAEDDYLTIESNWIIPSLLKHASIAGRVLEPCAGRGHLVVELRKRELDVTARDLVAHQEPLIDDIETPCDLDELTSLADFDWLVTNPPFADLDRRLAQLLELGARDGVGVAIFARMEWIAPVRRAALIHENERLAGLVVFSKRPRWIEGEGASPRHHFTWIIWSAKPRQSDLRPWVVFEHKAGGAKPEGTT